MRRNSVLMKVQVYNRLFNKNCLTQTETLFVKFFMFFFHITPGLLLLLLLLLDCYIITVISNIIK